MTGPIGCISKHALSAKVTATLALGVLLAAGAFVASASAEDRRDDHRGGRNEHYYHDNRGWNGGYYRAPPVIYGSPYAYQPYYPPPVVYGPSVGIYLPGVSIGIH